MFYHTTDPVKQRECQFPLDDDLSFFLERHSVILANKDLFEVEDVVVEGKPHKRIRTMVSEKLKEVLNQIFP